MSEFKNQIALVSGATRGIGKAISTKLLAAGAHVIGVYSSDEAAAEILRSEHVDNADHLQLIKCDISQEDQVFELFSTLDKSYGRLDILVNSAGIRRDAIVAMMKTDHWQEVIDTNLTGTYLLAKQAVLLMMKNKFGRIINITSPVAYLGFAGQANYAASKAGQIAMTKSLAKEVAKKKITVNCVSPGFIETDFIADLPSAQLAEYKKMIPVKRFGKSEEVADAVLFLAGKKSSYITGTTLDVTGGL